MDPNPFQAPVRSLVRFRCVSKSWLSLIDHPYFCRLHLRQSNNNNNLQETNLLVTERLYDWRYRVYDWYDGSTSKFFTVRSTCSDPTGQSSEVPAPLEEDFKHYNLDDLEIVCSWDGLVLLRNSYWNVGELMLWNPSIRRARLLPPSPPLKMIHGMGMGMMNLGFGFDPLINDYKLVRLPFSAKSGFLTRRLLSIQVYIVGANSWKTIPFQYHAEGLSDWCWDLTMASEGASLCFRGALYCTLFNKNSRSEDLVWFVLGKEVFASTVLPRDCTSIVTGIAYPMLVDDGGCSLRLVQPSSRQVTELNIWELDLSSLFWTKCYTFSLMPPPSGYGVRVRHSFDFYDGVILCLKKSTGDMLLITSWRRELISLNMKTSRRNPIFKARLDGELSDRICVYKESLLLLNG